MLGSFVSILGAALVGIWPTFGDDPLEATYPIEGKGDIPVQVDAVLFLEDGEPAIELELAIPRLEVGDSSADTTEIRVTVEMLDIKANGLARFATTVIVPPDTSFVAGDEYFPVPTQWLTLHPTWIPGTAGLRVTVEDMSRLKQGLVDKVRGKHRSGEVAGRVGLPSDRAPEEIDLSGLLFVWGHAPEERLSEGPGLRAMRSRLQPNPHRYYGLYQPKLTVYFERYGIPDELTAGDPVDIVYRAVTLPGEEPVFQFRDRVAAEDGARWELKRFDIGDLVSGSYRLEVRLENPETGTELARSEGRFQVLWEKNRWVLSEADLTSIARVLFSAEVYDSFAVLGRGEQEHFLREFWNEHDPTAPGQVNELEQTFYNRMKFAIANFTTLRSGMDTDRGRIFIRLGAPDEVTFNLNPQDEELLTYILPSEIDQFGDAPISDPYGAMANDGRLRETKSRSRLDNRAYEIWDYYVRGDPLLPEYIDPSMKTGIKFIFVDELGYGDFLLVYTNVSKTF